MSLITLFTVTFAFLLNALFGIQQEILKAAETESVLPLKVISLPFGLNILPLKKQGVSDPIIGARSAVVMDKDSGSILYQKRANETLEPASLTKLMTALVALDYLSLDQIVSVSLEATKVSGSRMYLLAGERIKVKDLLRGLLVASANDAASALALEVSGTIADFVQLMNNKALALGLTNTHFTNPQGLSNGEHRSSAWDIAFLTKEALENSIISEIVTIRETTVYDVSGHFSHRLKNTNKLVGQYENIIGGKTGTLESGESLAAAAKGTNDQIVIAVVLDSPDRFGEAASLLDWALKSYIWIGKL